MPDVEGRIALVTGGARGLGVEVCRQLAQAGMTVWLTARDGDRAAAVAAELASDGDVRPARLDITDPAEVEALAGRIERLDVLVNNAAIDFDTDARALTVDLDRVHRDLETNLFGAWRMAQAFTPHLRASPHARLVNVSSGAGSLADMRSGTPAYSTSKVALNGLTRKLARRTATRRRPRQQRLPRLDRNRDGRRRQSRRRGRPQHHLGLPARRRRTDRRLLSRRRGDRVVTR
jgi:NAD(P)-dependent dehydrogenase (short-subunit alcohol dehydrogenase family)